MKEAMFSLALAGLMLSIFDVAAPPQFERERMRLSKRLHRATGTGFALAQASFKQHSESSSHTLRDIRRTLARMGEQFAFELSGAAARNRDPDPSTRPV